MRILILRSCRLAQFLSAVVLARQRYPGAEIVALSHRGHRHVLRAAGVDRVIEMPGRRFGVMNVPPWKLAQVRAEGFDAIVIPQMNGEIQEHINVYRMVVALNPTQVLVMPGDERPRDFDRARFLSFVLQHTTSGMRQWSAAMFVVFAIGACERMLGTRLR